MKLKYCLQGFGVGVLFATVILSISFILRTNNSSMSDEEVMARARELGMVTETTTPRETSSVPPETTTPKETATEKAAADQEATTADEITTAPLETTTAEKMTTPPETTTAEKMTTPPETAAAPEPAEDSKIVIQVDQGMNSDVVARMLEEAEIIDSAVRFDAYMVQQGVSRYIRTGIYEFTKGMSYEELVQRMCR